jgi:hypothetical protein
MSDLDWSKNVRRLSAHKELPFLGSCPGRVHLRDVAFSVTRNKIRGKSRVIAKLALRGTKDHCVQQRNKSPILVAWVCVRLQNLFGHHARRCG